MQLAIVMFLIILALVLWLVYSRPRESISGGPDQPVIITHDIENQANQPDTYYNPDAFFHYSTHISA